MTLIKEDPPMEWGLNLPSPTFITAILKEFPCSQIGAPVYFPISPIFLLPDQVNLTSPKIFGVNSPKT